MDFELVRSRLKKLSEYRDDLAGDPANWRLFHYPDGSSGGWIHNDAIIEPGAVVEEGSIVFGKGVRLSPGTHVRGNSVVGPGVRTEGRVDIDRSEVCGYSWDQDRLGLPLHTKGLGWPRDRTLLRDSSVSEAKIVASGLDQAEVSGGAVVFGSGVEESIVSGQHTIVRGSLLGGGAEVRDGAGAYACVLREGARLSGRYTSAQHSTLGDHCRVSNGAWLNNCIVGSGAVVNRPELRRENEIIDDARYTLGAPPDASRRIRFVDRGACDIEGSPFRRETESAIFLRAGRVGERGPEDPQSFSLAH